MSSIISSYLFEPVARQARRFSNAPPSSNGEKTGSDHDSPQTIINPQGRAPSHVNDHFDHCASQSIQSNEEDSDSSELHDSELESIAPEEPLRSSTPSSQMTPHAMSFGQALFDRFVPRIISRPSNIGGVSSLCSPSVDHESTDDEDNTHQRRSSTIDQNLSSTSSVTLPLSEREQVSQTSIGLQRGMESSTEVLSNSLPTPTSVPTQTSPLRSGYRPFRRSTADARSLSRDIEALERAARSLGRTRGPIPPQKLPEDDGLQTLRQRIQAIWALGISTEEKARMMHAVMNETYYSLQPRARLRSNDGTIPDYEGASSPNALLNSELDASQFEIPLDPSNPFNLHDSDLVLSLRPQSMPDSQSCNPRGGVQGDDEESPTLEPDLGCVHYKRNVKIQCFECRTWWPCRLCHDDANLGHQLPRHQTRFMLCMLCSKPSEANQYCKHCSVRSSYYYCDVCHLWDDDSTKRIYHCPDCGICRIGEGIGKDYYHCKKCNICIPIQHESTHKCIERATECDCPICGAYMFNSSAAINAMPCGHYMHQKCYNDFISRAYRCPICQKSVVNMELQWRKLDDAISSQPMPAKLRDTVVEVRCNDCHGKSLCRYHWLGNRCGLCDSYNTLHVKFIKQGEQQQQQQQQQAGGEGDASSSNYAQSIGQRSPNLVPQRAQRYFPDDQEVAALEEALAAAQQQTANNQGTGALDSALALPGQAYRILAGMSRNLEPLRQYLSQMHPSMLEEAERLGLVSGEGAASEREIQDEGFWSSEDEDDDDDEEEASDLDLDADDENEDDEDEEDDEEEEEESESDEDEDEGNRLDIFLIGHR